MSNQINFVKLKLFFSQRKSYFKCKCTVFLSLLRKGCEPQDSCLEGDISQYWLSADNSQSSKKLEGQRESKSRERKKKKKKKKKKKRKKDFELQQSLREDDYNQSHSINRKAVE